jgi:hypothetical protein
MNIIFIIIIVSAIIFLGVKFLKKKKTQTQPKKEQPSHTDRTLELILFLKNNQEKIKTKEQLRDVILSFNFQFDSSNPELIGLLNKINDKINQG